MVHFGSRTKQACASYFETLRLSKSKGEPVRIMSAILSAFMSPQAFPCAEDTAYNKVQEEATSLGGYIKKFVRVDEGIYQGIVLGKVQLWNGREAWTTFVVDIDRRCQADTWRVQNR